MVGLRLPTISLDDMQRAIHRLAGHIYPEPAPVYTFARRLSAAAKKPVTNWRMNQEAVDHSWERQDAIRVGVKSRFRAEAARRWVDESLRRAQEGAR